MPAPAAAPETVALTLRRLAARPGEHFVRGWNWKSAAVSAVFRALIFLATTWKAGWRAALAALTVEAAFRIAATGLYGTLAQALRHAEPLWLSALILTVLAPAALQALELGVHWLAGTPNLWRGVAGSTAAAGIGSLFTWFAMRRGALLVGQDARPFAEDLRRYPGLIGEFVLALPRALHRRLRG